MKDCLLALLSAVLVALVAGALLLYLALNM